MPPAAYWVELLLDAIEVGLSETDRSQPEVRAALKFLKKDRTAQRVLSGTTRPERSWMKVTHHLAVLLLRPAWMPLHGDPISVTDLGAALRTELLQLERFAASTTISPNLGGAMTRAILRPLIILIAILFGRGASQRPEALLSFQPCRPGIGVGRVIDGLRRNCRPKTPTEKPFYAELGLSKRSWMRLVKGEIPSKTAIKFSSLAKAAAETEDARLLVEAAARRAFAGARLVNRLEREMPVGDNPQAFWNDCWTEFERVYGIARTQQTRISISSSPGRGMAEIRQAARRGARGIWTHAHHAIEPDFDYFGYVMACLLAFSAKGIPGDTGLIETALGECLDLIVKTPEIKARLAAIAAPSTDLVLRRLKALPESPGTVVALGNAYAKQGKLAEARAAFEKAFSLAPGDWLNRYCYARFEIQFGDARRALGALQDCQLASHHEYHAILGEACLKLGEYKQALTACEEAIRRQESLVETHRMAAECCRALGFKVKAKAYEKKWKRLGKNRPTVRA